MRHVSRDPQSCSWLVFDRINVDSKNSNQIHRHQKRIFWHSHQREFHTCDEWNHLLCLFFIDHFSSTVWSDTKTKRSQQDSGEERVTAKSRFMNLIVRTPSNVSSSISVSPEQKHYGSQDPRKSVAGEGRSGRFDKGTDLFEASDHEDNEQCMESFCFNKVNWWRPCLVFSRVEDWDYDVPSIRVCRLIKFLGEW